MKLILLICALMLCGCGTLGEGAAETEDVNDLLEALKFGEDEDGCLRIDGAVDLDPGVIGKANVNLTYKKENGDNAPEC